MQLTALAMEKQALLEDIAVGKEAHHEPLAAIERDEVRIILQLDELETQYGAELKLTEQLLACRSDISRRRKSLTCNNNCAGYNRLTRCWASTWTPGPSLPSSQTGPECRSLH